MLDDVGLGGPPGDPPGGQPVQPPPGGSGGISVGSGNFVVAVVVSWVVEICTGGTGGLEVFVDSVTGGGRAGELSGGCPGLEGPPGGSVGPVGDVVEVRVGVGAGVAVLVGIWVGGVGSSSTSVFVLGLLTGGPLPGGLLVGGLFTGGLIGGLIEGVLIAGGLFSGGVFAGGLVAGGLIEGRLIEGGLITGGTFDGELELGLGLGLGLVVGLTAVVVSGPAPPSPFPAAGGVLLLLSGEAVLEVSAPLVLLATALPLPAFPGELAPGASTVPDPVLEAPLVPEPTSTARASRSRIQRPYTALRKPRDRAMPAGSVAFGDALRLSCGRKNASALITAPSGKVRAAYSVRPSTASTATTSASANHGRRTAGL